MAEDVTGDSLDALFGVGKTFCVRHKVIEPTTAATYMLCIECGHAFQTEADMVALYNQKAMEVWQSTVNMNTTDPDWTGPEWPASILVNAGKQIRFCPICDHTF